MISRKTVARMSLYRRLLDDLQGARATHVYSHQLARLAGVTAAQVRRDLMAIGYSGSPNRGYEVDKCLESIGSLLDGLGAPGRRARRRRPPGPIGHLALRRPAADAAHRRRLRHRPLPGGDLHRRLPLLLRRGDGAGGARPRRAHRHRHGAAGSRPGGREHASCAPACAASSASRPCRCACRRTSTSSTSTSPPPSSRPLTSPARARSSRPSPRTAPRPPEGDSIVKELESLLARSHMKLQDLAAKIGATVISPGKPDGTEVTHIYAGDRVSDLLNRPRRRRCWSATWPTCRCCGWPS